MQRSQEIYYRIGIGILRYGLVGLLFLWGSFKFFNFEAMAIQPLVEHSPFLGWLLPVFGLRATSDIIGVFEIGAGLLIGSRRLLPRLSAYGSLAATGMFAITLSFLVTTPGALGIASPLTGFLLKDIMFLGGALVTAAEAFAAEQLDDPRASQLTVAI
jgi:reactive chlorine resistance protein C